MKVIPTRLNMRFFSLSRYLESFPISIKYKISSMTWKAVCMKMCFQLVYKIISLYMTLYLNSFWKEWYPSTWRYLVVEFNSKMEYKKVKLRKNVKMNFWNFKKCFKIYLMTKNNQILRTRMYTITFKNFNGNFKFKIIWGNSKLAWRNFMMMMWI